MHDLIRNIIIRRFDYFKETRLSKTLISEIKVSASDLPRNRLRDPISEQVNAIYEAIVFNGLREFE